MTTFAHGPETIKLGDLEVCRMGYGAMRLPGEHVWGEPKDPDRARAVLRRAVELGVRLIDTAWYYGPWVANRLIVEALHPYPAGLVIATKLGGKRLPDRSWAPATRPEELRQGCEDDLRTLKLERCDVTHLRWIPGGAGFDEALDAMIALKDEGKIRHLALSNVGSAQLDAAMKRTPIVAVQNMYNLAGKSPFPGAAREDEPADVVLDLCTKRGLAYLPFFPLVVGQVGRLVPAIDGVAKKHGATTAQIAIAALLARSPSMLPIPGTSSPEHLEENWAARAIQLDSDDLRALAAR